ncbi:hypothetical protein AB4121_08920 [Vibrio sp. 10N.286.54.B2]|uniref:hypothetical protein n=1 Tax=Vibrio sp. 10N.286.54.B2 TaxID=3229718 RepID=UPI00354B6907
MSILTKLTLASEQLKRSLNQPENVTLRRMFQDGVPFKCRKAVFTAAIIEKTEPEQRHQLAYVLGEQVIAALKPNHYQVKEVNVVSTADGRTRVVLTNPYSNIPWVISNRKALDKAVKKPVSVVRDHDAKVYDATVHHDHENFNVSNEAVEDVVSRVFGDYYIDSIDHPVVRELVKQTCANVDGVVTRTSLSVDTVTVEPETTASVARDPNSATNDGDKEKDNLLAELEIGGKELSIDEDFELSIDMSLDELKL